MSHASICREGFVLAVPITRLLPQHFSRCRPHGLFILPHQRSAGTFPRKVVPKHSRQLRPADAVVVFATTTITHATSRLTIYTSCPFRGLVESNHPTDGVAYEISIIFIVPEFKCTSRCSRIRDPGFDNAVALRQQYIRPITGSTVFSPFR